MRRYSKKKNQRMFLILLLLGLSVGFALLNSNLNILGFTGINKNTYNIHWDDRTIDVTSGSVTAKTAAYVTDTEKQNISFAVDLELPGDYYEFTVDAKNDGSIDGIIDGVKISFFEADGTTPIAKENVPSYFKYSFKQADGVEVKKGQILRVGKSIKYRVRVEFDREAEELPTEPKTIVEVIEFVDNPQPNPRKYYAIDYDPNGGVVDPGAVNVEKGNKLGTLPAATKKNKVFTGWSTEEDGPVNISSDTIPTKNTTYYAQYRDSEAMFDIGRNVNTKFKQLAGDELNATTPYYTADTNITSITRSQTIDDSLKTEEHKVSTTSSKSPIYAWYDNGTIYYYSEAEIIDLNNDSSYMFSNIQNATSLDTSFSTSNAINMANMFSGSKFTELNLNDFDTSNVTNMQAMFSGYSGDTLDLRYFNTGNVTNMKTMFAGNQSTTINLSNFNTSNVEDMEAMFTSTKVTSLDLSSFNTSNVKMMASMFTATKLTSLDLSSFDISNVTNMGEYGGLFGGSYDLESLNISGWNFNKVTSMYGFFGGLNKLSSINLEGVNTSKVTTMESLFAACSSLTELDLTSLDVSKVTNFSNMLGGCTNLVSLDISGWNFASVTSLSGFFNNQGLTKLETINFDNVNTSTITNMSGMFSGCIALKSLDLTSFDVSNVTTFSGMLGYCSNLKTMDISGWDFASITSLSGFFAQSLSGLETINLRNVNTSTITNMSGMFSGCSSLKTLDLTSFDVSHVTTFGGIIGGCSSLTSIDMSGWDFSATTSLSGLFNGSLTRLESINLTNVNTSTITDMSSMFYGCTALKSLDLRSFDTKKVTTMYQMFTGDSALETITVSDNFLVDQVTNSYVMFGGCSSLVGGLGTVYDSSHIDKEYAHYDEGEDNPGYFNAGNVEFVTVTFNPNGGEVTPTTKEVVKGKKIGNLPEATKDGKFFKGWYTGTTDGIKLDANYIVEEDMTVYAHYYDSINITYDANEGKFSNNETSNEITYNYGLVPSVRYSHTSNMGDDGVATKAYDNGLSTTDVVSMPGSSQLEVEVWFTTESTSYDWLAIYEAGITPDQNNYSSSISNKLGGYGSYSGYTKPNDSDTTYHRTFTITGDTVQFYFRSDSSNGNYGYYAIVRGIGGGYAGDKEYQVPTRVDNKFLGWTKNSDGTGTLYKTESDVINDIDNIGNNSTIYAKWIREYTITLNPNGGELEETTRKVPEGEKLGNLPIPTKLDHSFQGWYTELIGGTKVDKNFIPTQNQTIYAHWDMIEAVFDTGSNVNIKFKTLAGTVIGSYTYGTLDKNIIAIRKSETQPDLNEMTEANIVSASTSRVPIYAWFDDGTIYWWTSADKAYTNQNASYMFYYYDNLKDIDIAFDTSLTETAQYMFNSLKSIENLDLSSFNTINLRDARWMVYGNQNLQSIDISGWDTRKATQVTSIIGSNPKLEYVDMTGFDFTASSPNINSFSSDITSGGNSSLKTLILDGVVFPQKMASGLRFIENVEEISLKDADTSHVTDMQSMFWGARKVKKLDLSSFDTSNVTDMSWMFNECNNLEVVDVSSFDTSKVTNLDCLFYNVNKMKKLDLSNFNTSNVTKAQQVFEKMDSLEELNLSNWDFRKIYLNVSLINNLFYSSMPSNNVLKVLKVDNATLPIDSNYAFAEIKHLEVLSMENIHSSDTTNMQYLVANNPKLKEIHIEALDTTNAANVYGMFWNCPELTTIYAGDKFIVKSSANSTNMFLDSTKIVGGMGTTYDANFVDKTYARYDGGETNPGYFTKGSTTTRYTVTFNANGGVVNEKSRKVVAGKTLVVLPTPSKDNAEFLGWYTSLTAEGVLVDSSYVINKNQTLYAKWDDLGKNTITFDPNGGTLKNRTKVVVEGEKIGRLPKPTKDKNIFVGWFKDLDSDDIITSEYIPTEDETLYAKWRDPNKYTVTFEANGGSVDPTSRQITEGRTIGELPTPTWTKHEFQGWYTDLTAGTKIDAGYIPNTTETVYAHWKEIYTVTYNANGGSVSPASVDVIQGNSISSLPTPTKENSEFLGWYTGLTDGTKVSLPLTPSADTTIYARWLNPTNITFNANGGSFSENEETNEVLYVLQKTTTTKYSRTSNINTRGVASKIYSNNLNTTDTVTMDDADELEIEIWYSTEASYDWVAIYPADVTPSASNFSQATISGGKLDGHGSYKTYTKPNDSDTTYHRKFTVKGDTVKFYFKSDGSTGYYGYYAIITGKKSAYYPSESYQKPSKADYAFAGWTTNSDGSGTLYESEEDIIDHISELDENTTLYAKWIQVDGVDFSTSPWIDIKGAYELGETEDLEEAMNNGTTRDVDLGDLGVHPLRIANITPCSETTTTSKTTCGLVLEFADIITTHRMNPFTSDTTGNGNIGGWEKTEMRTYVNNSVYNALPSDLKKKIINTTVVSGHGRYDIDNITTTDKLYLLSIHEIYGVEINLDTASSSDITRQLDYYKNAGVTHERYSGAIKKYNGTDTTWWLRAPYNNNYTGFLYAYSNGEMGVLSIDATETEGVSPAFRLSD